MNKDSYIAYLHDRLSMLSSNYNLLNCRIEDIERFFTLHEDTTDNKKQHVKWCIEEIKYMAKNGPVIYEDHLDKKSIYKTFF